MKFNKLYLHGFKSFVEKTAVDFHSGITAIVGPNGSGKSNIMDAVRWVFGEQNAKELRGTDMEDVVFNGSQKRKAAGFAEVGLTLSEIDEATAAKYGTFSEITITRKFYKTGEREYFINNRKCRLKDIKDIFMDTGLGARSISIIEQGKVDRIINATPEELRFFLEETAGVTKFKDKKKEAERRLQQTKDNLDRVNDIVTEILGRLESLDMQVETLKKGEDLQSRKVALEKKFLCSAYSSKANEQSTLTQKHDVSKIRLEEQLIKYAAFVKDETQSEALYSEKEKLHSQIQEERLETTKYVTKTHGEIGTLEARLAAASDTQAQLEHDIEDLVARLENHDEKSEALTDELETAETALEEINDKIYSLQDTIDDIKFQKTHLEDEFKESDVKFLEFTSSITDTRNEIIRIETHLETQKAAFERLNTDKQKITETALHFAAQWEEVQKKLAQTLAHANSVDEKLAELKMEGYELKKLLDDHKIKQSELTSAFKHLNENKSFLITQIDDSAFGKDDKLFFEKFKPTLAIDRFKGKGFSTEAITELGDIFIFNDINEVEVKTEAENIKSSIRFIFENSVHALEEVARKGEIQKISDHIFITHGIYKKIGDDDKSLKILTLKQKLDETEEKLRINITETQSNAAHTAEAQALITQKDAEIKEEERNLLNAKTTATQYTAQAESMKSNKEQSAKQIATIEKEIQLMQSFCDEAEERRKKLVATLEDVSRKQAELEEERLELEEKRDNISDKLDEKREEMQELKVLASSRSEILNSAKKQIEASKMEKDSLEKNLENLKNRLYKLINEDVSRWQSDVEDLRARLITFQTMLLETESALKDSAQSMEELKLNLETLKKETEITNNAVKEADDEVRKTELSLASIAASIESDVNQYSEKFGEDIKNVFHEFADTDFQPRKTKDEILLLEDEIEKLGPLNLNALNDYEEAKSRYDFLTAQRTDLEGSIADINGFISDTDETTVKIFQETFYSVKEKFVEVFHILFGNGEAELRLTDYENMLTSGVEIYIQPPGKKLQHMGLLSGGEKALTAMTLLFALFLQRPTPFCFLDEVDAPLDDANVNRYINMVKALSDKTQFILITHNHNTMAMADSLYGVTMQEYGVSSILSVKLEDVDKAGR